jgi:hypothetical protein
MRRVVLGLSAICLLALFIGFAPQDRPRAGGFPRFDRQQDSTRMAKLNAEIDQKLEELKKQIAGKEEKMAPEVFKSIQTLKQVKAGELINRMEVWSRSLGISCDHCHVPDKWEKEDKGEKEAARGMDGMMGEINSKLIVNVKNLDSKTPSISCWTCHQGRVKPSRPPWARNARREN